MFFHKHTYNPDKAIINIVSIINDLEKSVKEIKDDVAYLIEMLDERD
jgi:hypothetical protein